MWLLENDGDVFNGKRLWLCPGKKYIFGRTLAEAGGFVVENKTISRKHLIIEVANVKPGDGLLPWTRSQVILEDLNTKIGTQVNGIQIRGQRHPLEGGKHELKLGQYDKLFRITWNPIVLSFSFTGKELKTNPLAFFTENLENLDIKVLIDYIRESTTHVVASKRNTSKGLQALINGKHIVDNTFIDAIAAVAHSEGDGISPLEVDFDLNWPDALKHLPPRGQEPTERRADAYSPNPARQEIFDGYTFVFCDQSQFENLLAPITNGRGKALLRQIDPKITQVEDFIRYVKGVAGEKGLGEFEDGSEGKGVVVVKYQPAKGPTSEWYKDFGRRVALHLDHRLIEQSEFLDAILNNDASVLRKPLEIESADIITPPPITATMVTLKEPSSTVPLLSVAEQGHDLGHPPESTALGLEHTPTLPPRRIGRSRRAITSRFKGFDDDFDSLVSDNIKSESARVEPPQTQESGLFVSQDQEIEADNPPLSVATQSWPSRKRLSPPLIEEDEDIMDQLAPAAANLKRRRLAEEATRRRRDGYIPTVLLVVEEKPEPRKEKKGKAKPEIDVLEVARQKREMEEAIAQAERDALQAAMDGMDIEQIRNLAVVEEMEVRRIAPPPTANAHGDEGDRWDERWNGRKNFKKFRRRGEGSQRPVNKVIVPLEEVKKKDFGIGDRYWLEGDKDNQKKKMGRGRPRQDQLINQTLSQSVVSQIQVNEEVIIEETETVDPPIPQRATRSQKPPGKTKPSQIRQSPSKRIAEPLTKPAPTKRVKQAARKGDSDGSDDGLGFRFRKR